MQKQLELPNPILAELFASADAIPTDMVSVQTNSIYPTNQNKLFYPAQEFHCIRSLQSFHLVCVMFRLHPVEFDRHKLYKQLRQAIDSVQLVYCLFQIISFWLL